ncbi:MAG: hypothetical protein GX221_09870 [Candidatus Riflebacteria bacterium]|nr:hypothetical protein [Candidatus Riflebacteria bacterium]
MNQKFKTSACLLMLLLASFVTSSLQAQSVRSRGMGSAFIGLSNDESAIFYNPAGLSQIEGREASIQAKVNERDTYEWQSFAFTGHIYESEQSTGFSIADYLEENILEEPMPRKPKYSYGMSYTMDKRPEAFGKVVGGSYSGLSTNVSDFQLAFGTKFPVAKNLLAREQLYGGLKLRILDVDRKNVALGTQKTRKSYSMGAGLIYHYNDRITGGLVVDNLFEHLDDSNVAKDGISLNIGAAIKVAQGTTISMDLLNITDSGKAYEQQYRVGVEKYFTENDFAVRIGSCNGTLSVGFGMNIMPNLRVDYSYYDGEKIPEHHVGAHFTFD